MNEEVKEITEIPAALPISDGQDEREKFLNQTTGEDQIPDDDLDSDVEEDEFDEFEEQLAKPSKKKLFFAFVCFVFGFVFLVALLSWFFGIGVFAKGKLEAVDSTAKDANSATSNAPINEEEKLKMALNLVADKEKNGQTDLSDSNTDLNISDDPNISSSIDIPSTKATDITEPLVMPGSLANPSPNPADVSANVSNSEPYKQPNYQNSSKPQTYSSNESKSVLSSESNITNGDAPLGRSLFFGIERKKNAAINLASTSNDQRVVRNNANSSSKIKTIAKISFGTLLPIRFLGAVYTFRTSGGLVRMELTRHVSGKNYEFPAGTILVGSLRGSEYKRAFISVVGLIDPKTGGLVKFGGEVMGTDGASGVVGRRRKVKSAWSRVLGGLRDAGAMALGAISNRRSGGGTVIISDSTKQASSSITDELSGLVGDKRKSNEFVEIPAGTNAFVQVTDLPDEISITENFAETEKSSTGLSTNELADLLSFGSPEKIRAALPKMTPEIRSLAESVLEIQK